MFTCVVKFLRLSAISSKIDMWKLKIPLQKHEIFSFMAMNDLKCLAELQGH
jgi:hypothetical protein